jgi:transglutaminase-like putative cysteine protease
MLHRNALIVGLWLVYVLGSIAQDKPGYSVAFIDTSLLPNTESIIRHETVQYTIHDPRTYTCTVNRAVTILRENADEIWVRVMYDKYSKVDLQMINIYDAAGRLIRKVKKSELQDRAIFDGISLYTDNRWVGFQALGGSLPYTIETQYQQRFSETMYYPPWQSVSYNQSAERAALIIDAPVEMAFHLMPLNYNFNYSARQVDGRQIHHWTVEKIQARDQESNGPLAREVLPVVMLAPAKFQVEAFTGSMDDWKSFGRFIYDINKGTETMPPVMIDVIQRITNGLESDTDKIDTLYQWLQNNMRYVSVQLGIGGWRSFDAEYVEKNRYGDCKALSTFMKGMLQTAGIEAHTFLIEAGEHDNLFMDDFVFPDFNHMMLYVPGEDMWLECTSQYLQAGQLHDAVENKKVLLITPEGGVIARTKASAANDNVIHQVDTITLGSLISLKGKRAYTGTTQPTIVHLSHRPVAEQQEYFLADFPFSVKTLHQFDFVNEPGGSMFHDYDATLQQLGNKSGSRLFIPARSFVSLPEICPGDKERTMDYISHDNYTVMRDTYVRIPDDYKVEFLPAGIDKVFKDQVYTLEFSQAGQYIKIHTVDVNAPMRLTPAEYHDWCAFIVEMAKAANQQVVLVAIKP